MPAQRTTAMAHPGSSARARSRGSRGTSLRSRSRRRYWDGRSGAVPWTGNSRWLSAAESKPPFATEEELGELLLDVVRAARARGLDAERALRGAVGRL